MGKSTSRSRLASLIESGGTASRSVLAMLNLNKDTNERLPSSIADISYIPTPDSDNQESDCVLTVAIDDGKENSTATCQETKKTLQQDTAAKPQKSRRALTADLEKMQKQNKALQELCAKQRLDLDDATRDAAQAGRLSAVVFKLELEMKDLKSKSGARTLQHVKSIDTSVQDAIRLATMSRKAAAAGEAADAAQQQLREAKHLHDLELSELQQRLEVCAADAFTLQHEAASSQAQAKSAQQQLRDAHELHVKQQAHLQQQLNASAEEVVTLERKFAASQTLVDTAQEHLQHATQENRQQVSDLQQQLSAATSQIHILKLEAESISRLHASELSDRQQQQSEATASAAEQFNSSISALKAEHDNALTALQARVVSMSCQHMSEIAALKLQHTQQLEAVRQQYVQSTAAAKQQHQDRLYALKLQNDKAVAAAGVESVQHTAAVSALQSELCNIKRQLQQSKNGRFSFEPHAVGPICVPAVQRQCQAHEKAIAAIQNALEVTQAKYAAAKVHSLCDMSAFSAVQTQLHSDLKEQADGLASAQSRLQQAHEQQPTLPLTTGMQQLRSILSTLSGPSTTMPTKPELRRTADVSESADPASTASPLIHSISAGSRLSPGAMSHCPTTSNPHVQSVLSSDAGHLLPRALAQRQSPAAAHPRSFSTDPGLDKMAAKDSASASHNHSCGEESAKTVRSGYKKESAKAVNDFLAAWADVKARTSAFFANLERVERKFEAGRVSRALREKQEAERAEKILEECRRASADDVDYDSDDSWCIDDPTD